LTTSNTGCASGTTLEAEEALFGGKAL